MRYIKLGLMVAGLLAGIHFGVDLALNGIARLQAGKQTAAA